MTDLSLDSIGRVSVEWPLLGLRIAFIVILYLFIAQVVRVVARETRQIALEPAARPRKPASPRKPAATAEAGSTTLEMLDPGESAIAAGTYLSVTPPFFVGRDLSCHLILDDPFVSTSHAELGRDGDGWWVADLGSTNGTFVNGALLTTAATLDEGDVVQFGRIRLRFGTSNRTPRGRAHA